jgi:hypothetical protein
MKEKAKRPTRQGQPQISILDFKGKDKLFFCKSVFKHLHNLNILNWYYSILGGGNNER